MTVAAPSATIPTARDTSATANFTPMGWTCEVQYGAQRSAFSSLFAERARAANVPMPATPSPPSGQTTQGSPLEPPACGPGVSRTAAAGAGGPGTSACAAGAERDELAHDLPSALAIRQSHLLACRGVPGAFATERVLSRVEVDRSRGGSLRQGPSIDRDTNVGHGRATRVSCPDDDGGQAALHLSQPARAVLRDDRRAVGACTDEKLLSRGNELSVSAQSLTGLRRLHAGDLVRCNGRCHPGHQRGRDERANGPAQPRDAETHRRAMLAESNGFRDRATFSCLDPRRGLESFRR